MRLQQLLLEARRLIEADDLYLHIGGVVQDDLQGPKEANDVYLKCRAKNDNKAYCARVAWQVYCQNINPGYKGCTKYGKTGASKLPLAK